MAEKQSSADLLDAESDFGHESSGGRMCVGGFPKKRCIAFIVLGVLAVLMYVFWCFGVFVFFIVFAVLK